MESRLNLSEKKKFIEILKWTISKFKGINIAYWILLLLTLPGVEVFAMITTSYKKGLYVSEMKDTAVYIAGTIFVSVAIATSIILALISFSYLHNKRRTDLFGSLPISRRGLFFARYLGAIIAVVVPFVLVGILGGIMSGSWSAFAGIMKVVLLSSISIVGNVTIIAFIALCCGTVVDVMVSYGIINIVYPICMAIVSYFPSHIIPGLTMEEFSPSIYTFLCPIAAPFTGVFGYETDTIVYVVWWLLLNVGLLVASYFLCKKRKTETAQNAFAFSVVEIVIKFFACLTAGFGFGWMLSLLGDSSENVTSPFTWFIVGLMIADFVANFLIHLIYHRGIKGILGSFKEVGVVFVTAMALLIIICRGGFGYDTRIPDKEDILEVSVNTTGESLVMNGKDLLAWKTSDSETIDDVYYLHSRIISQLKEQKNASVFGYSIARTTNSYVVTPIGITSVWFEYKLKNGTTLKRKFYGEDISYDLLIEKKLKKLAKHNNDVNVIRNISVGNIGDIHIYEHDEGVGAWVYEVNGVRDNYMTMQGAKNLLQALQEDLENNANDEVGALYTIRITIGRKLTSGNYYDSMYDAMIYVNENFVHTLAVMKRQGLENIKYLSIMNKYFTYSEKDIRDSGRVVYFKMPTGWRGNGKVHATLYSDLDEYFVDFKSDKTICEEVQDGIYKFTVPEISESTDDYYSDVDWDRVIFYQLDEQNQEFINTGCVRLGKSGQMLRMIGEGYYTNLNEINELAPLDTYTWEDYK